MNKIVKITDDEIFIGKEDGSVVTTEKSNASWDVKVGDIVELFVSGDTVILNLAKKQKTNVANGFLGSIVKCCQKILPIVFSSMFVLFLTALIVISSVPRGNKYTYETNIGGMEISSVVTFDGDEITLTSYYELNGESEDEVVTSNYKITDGKLYTYNLTTKEYNYAGKISSTEAVIENEGMKLVYKENTMITLRTMSIVFMIIFAVLDTAAIAVMLLTKKGVIKLNNSSTAVVNAEPEKTEEVAAE